MKVRKGTLPCPVGVFQYNQMCLCSHLAYRASSVSLPLNKTCEKMVKEDKDIVVAVKYDNRLTDAFRGHSGASISFKKGNKIHYLNNSIRAGPLSRPSHQCEGENKHVVCIHLS